MARTLVGSYGQLSAYGAEPQYAGSGSIFANPSTIIFDGKTLHADAEARLWENVGTGQTVTDLGHVLIAAPGDTTSEAPMTGNYLRWARQQIDDTMDEYVLAYTALTTNQTVHGLLEYKEHG